MCCQNLLGGEIMSRDFGNALPLHQDLTRREHPAGLHVRQAGVKPLMACDYHNGDPWRTGRGA